MKLARFAVALMLLAAVPAAADDCQDADLHLAYGATTVTMTFTLDAHTCGDPSELGLIDVEASLERAALFGASTITFVETFCEPASCLITLSIDHPEIEALVRYQGEVSWRSTGPGPRLIGGAAAVRMTCEIATRHVRTCSTTF